MGRLDALFSEDLLVSTPSKEGSGKKRKPASGIHEQKPRTKAGRGEKKSGPADHRESFKRIARAVSQLPMLGKEEISKIFLANEERIIELATKERDVESSLMNAMRNVSLELAFYLSEVEKRSKDAQLSPLGKEAVRQSLLEAAPEIFSDALSRVNSVDETQKISHAIANKLAETTARTIGRIRENTEQFPVDAMSGLLEKRKAVADAYKRTHGRYKLEDVRAEEQAIEKKIEEAAPGWIDAYVDAHPDASAEDVMEEADRLDLVEEGYVQIDRVRRAVAARKKFDAPMSMDAYTIPEDRTTDRQRASQGRIRRLQDLAEGIDLAPDMPEEPNANPNGAPSVPLDVRRTVRPAAMENDGQTLVAKQVEGATAVAHADDLEAPPVGPEQRVVGSIIPGTYVPRRPVGREPRKPEEKPGVMSRLAGWGRSKWLAMGLLLGLGAGDRQAEQTPRAPEPERTELSAPIPEARVSVSRAPRAEAAAVIEASTPARAEAVTETPAKLTKTEAKKIVRDANKAAAVTKRLGTAPSPGQPRETQRAEINASLTDLETLRTVAETEGAPKKVKVEIEDMRSRMELVRAIRNLK